MCLHISIFMRLVVAFIKVGFCSCQVAEISFLIHDGGKDVNTKAVPKGKCSCSFFLLAHTKAAQFCKTIYAVFSVLILTSGPRTASHVVIFNAQRLNSGLISYFHDKYFNLCLGSVLAYHGLFKQNYLSCKARLKTGPRLVN